MTPAAAVRAEAVALGADIEVRSGRGELDVSLWLPAGSVWVATGSHSLSAHYFSDPDAGWRALLADVRLGREPCRDVECDTCADR